MTGTAPTRAPTEPQKDFGTRLNETYTTDEAGSRLLRQQKRAIKKMILKDLGLDPKKYFLKDRKDPERLLIDSKVNEYAAMKAIREAERDLRQKTP